jgi:hypothetical protein
MPLRNTPGAAPGAAPEAEEENAAHERASKEKQAKVVEQIYNDLGIDKKEMALEQQIHGFLMNEIWSNRGTPRSAARFLEEKKLPLERVDQAIVDKLLNGIPTGSTDMLALDIQEAIKKYPRTTALIKRPELQAAARARVLETLNKRSFYRPFIDLFVSPEELSSMMRDALLGLLEKDLARGELRGDTQRMLKDHAEVATLVREDASIHAAASALLEKMRPIDPGYDSAHQFFEALGLDSRAAAA